MINNQHPYKMEYQQYRFDFTDEFGKALSGFALRNIEADRKTFSKEWEFWCDNPEIKDSIMCEIATMKQKGFEGDVLDKMFKSVRYYHRKNVSRAKEIKYKNEPKRHSNRFTKTFLEIIDAHIYNYIKERSDKSPESRICLSQSEAYKQFCETNSGDIYVELLGIKRQRGLLDAETIPDKFKKAYKTRFYTKRKAGLYNFAE
jgi:hypothetical protein